MISSLSITNYALIRQIEFAPCDGLNIITGETGAGKSIIMGALSLLQGRRADPKVVTNQNEKSVVEARFELSDELSAIIEPIFKTADIPTLNGYCIIHREISPTGRSRAFVNDSPVTLATLEQIADHLIDIHSQHKNLLIAQPDFQRQVIDNLACNDDLLTEYHTIYGNYRHALRRFVEMRDQIEQTRVDSDYLQYQLDELNATKLIPGEDNEIDTLREELANASEISTLVTDAARALSLGDQNADTLTAFALESLRRLSEIAPAYQQYADRLTNIRVELTDISESIAEQASTLRDDPKALEELDKRADRIQSLKNKHKVDTVEQLIAIRDNLASRLTAMTDADNVLNKLEREARSLKRQAVEIATRLSQKRIEAAKKLEKLLCERATPLGLPNLVCDISITSGKLNPEGSDTVEYLFAFNKNQQPLPIGQTASGGEISRVMLALKSILAEHINLPTIIFDEIDTGVSGDVANRMGALMAMIGRQMQVITITHLPQVAACGSAHFKVFKHDNEDATETQILKLSDDQRRHELALMLSGNTDDTAALATADSLLTRHFK